MSQAEVLVLLGLVVVQLQRIIPLLRRAVETPVRTERKVDLLLAHFRIKAPADIDGGAPIEALAEQVTARLQR